MINRLLPALASAMNRTPTGVQRVYGDLSNRILDSSAVYREMRTSLGEMGAALMRFDQPARSATEERLHRLASGLRPWTAPGLSLERLGGDGDGAYVMVDPSGSAGALSIGVGHDVSWDRAVAARGVPVAMFDPTVSSPPTEVPGARFFPVGLGPPRPTPLMPLTGLDLRPLDELLSMAGFPAGSDLVLKVDIEGAEWAALEGVSFAPFRQVALELHDIDGLADQRRADAMLAVVDALATTHLPVHVHANNERPFRRFDGIWFPEVIEATFVRRDLMPQARPADALATALDRATNPRFPDYDLSGILTAPA